MQKVRGVFSAFLCFDGFFHSFFSFPLRYCIYGVILSFSVTHTRGAKWFDLLVFIDVRSIIKLSFLLKCLS